MNIDPKGPMNLITMDVGNTNIKFGLWVGKSMIHTWRSVTRLKTSGDELGLVLEGFLRLNGLKFNDVADLVVVSVVPPMRPAIERMGNRYLNRSPIFVQSHTQTIMPVLYENPSELGSDRVVGAVAAYRRVKGPLIV
ncbi:MAG: type III pantothenate kinase, partial [Deltaproteobacteria bacterium]|nr:type III pantothenate kinase [Deltaproteobacteria bacterium]